VAGILDSIRSFLGLGERDSSPTPVYDGGRRVIPDLPLYLQMQRIGGGLTPLQVSEIIREADLGRMARLVDLANEARQKDCHLQSVLGTRENALCGLPWQATVPDGARRKDKKAAEWLSESLQNAQNFRRAIAHTTGGVYYGYANTESLFEMDAGRITPVNFEPISPRRFCFDQKSGRLHWWDASGSGAPYPGIDLQKEYPGHFLQFQPRINGDVPCREGLVRVLMWAALFRNWDLRDWLSLGELAWKPWRTGKYKKEASREDKDNLLAILQGMSASGVAIYPDSTELEVNWPKNTASGSTHAELFATIGAEMSKAVLGQTLTTEQGDRGSQSLGKVHDNVRRDILEADATAVAEVIRRDLIVPLMRWNFGPDVLIPDFKFITEDAVDLVAFSTGVKTLRDAGLPIQTSWVRDQAGIPEPLEGEELLAPPAPPPTPGGGEEDDDDGKKDPGAAEDAKKHAHGAQAA
jgi:phage gp29-like protein